ncbi:MAG: hypothetical protein WA254_02430, partial [Candidatus Sulfotelmatobacter sp.]
LSKYEKAFALFQTTYQFQVPDLVRQTMVFVALNLDFKANDNKEAIQNLFGSTSGFLQNDSNIETVLTAIKKINYEDGGL